VDEEYTSTAPPAATDAQRDRQRWSNTFPPDMLSGVWASLSAKQRWQAIEQFEAGRPQLENQ